ncbi:RNA methyltransferase [Corynebacterium sp.]|uniref:TrmH family RNA methyltransferase n=1 Tax=Corynebacterium sp. TaxID=1720 RepID=UPI0026DBA1F5|nr:RNA methyltransferase [Corynebacterium sp.]MDO4609250.1 RNA methyltransferase [Corynebacterium sp.]
MPDTFTRPAESFTERTPRVVSASKLHRAAARRKTGRFLAEGPNSVEAAIAAGAAVEVFAAEKAMSRHVDLLDDAVRAGIVVSAITDRAAASLAETVTTAGLFAVCAADRVLREPGEVLDRACDASASQARMAVIAVGISDPGNAGTVIRMADALGAAGVVFAGETVDPLGGKAVRSSAGSVFHVPVARTPDVAGTLAAAAERGVVTLATAMDGDLVLGADPLPAAPVAWLTGNEAHGLPDDVLAATDATVSIPMRGGAESLNLATAAAMCLWETARAPRG